MDENHNVLNVKKIYALKQVDKRLVGTKEISVKQSNEIRNNEGKSNWYL